MRRAAACILTVSVLSSVSFSLLAAAADYTPGGAGSIAQNWMSQDGDRVMNLGKPILLFMFRSDKGNPDAKALESSDFLGAADVQQQLKSLHLCKFDIARSDKMPKNWPPVVVERAKLYKNAVAIIQSDFSNAVFFRKAAPDGGAIEPTAKNLLAVIEKAVAYETKKKELDAKKPKPPDKKDDPPAEKDKPKLPGWDDPDKNKDPKKDPKKEEKKEEKKKVIDE